MPRHRKHITVAALLALCISLGVPLHVHAADGVAEENLRESLIRLKGKAGRSTQVLFVRNTDAAATAAAVYAAEKKRGTWVAALGPFEAVIGKNGFAAPGEKREGDGKTPSGMFRLGTAFGYAPAVDTRMPYRQATNDDLWVDDAAAEDYNRWVKKGETRARSYEKMRRDDERYKYGLVIEYNTLPVIRGLGSAIFLHLWKEPGVPTEGCVALSEGDMLRLLGWLDPAAQPLVILGARNTAKEPHR